VKQNNITMRGFEITGKRTFGSGDNLIFEYNWIHDTTLIGPGLTMPDYTSYPDGSAAQIIQRPSTNITLRHFRIERTYGEGITWARSILMLLLHFSWLTGTSIVIS